MTLKLFMCLGFWYFFFSACAFSLTLISNMSDCTHDIPPSEKNIFIGGASLDEYLIANFGRFEEAYRQREYEKREEERIAKLRSDIENAKQKKITGYLIRGRDEDGFLIMDQVGSANDTCTKL